MANTEILLSIPEELAKNAKEFGLLTQERIIALIEADVTREIRRDEAIALLRQIKADLDTLPPMSMEEIEEAIREVRREA